MIQNLIDYMKGRLIDIEIIVKQGVIPSQLDSYDLEQLIGRIKELKKTIAIAEEMKNE